MSENSFENNASQKNEYIKYAKLNNCKFDNDTLKKLQEAECEILTALGTFCDNHNIKYSIFYGTMLGAVRHNGFIPWDDDIDVVMPIDDYLKFIKLWKEESPEGYSLQIKETEPNYTRSFAKIRKNNTTFLQFDFEAGKINTGIFVDIFPLFRKPKNKLQKFRMYCSIVFLQLFSREFVPNDSNFFVKSIAKIVLFSTPKSKILKRYESAFNEVNRYFNDKSLPFVNVEPLSDFKHEFSSKLFDEISDVEFGTHKYKMVSNANDILQYYYGDYMKFPPKEEQVWSHCPIVLDFEHSFEELSQNNE